MTPLCTLLAQSDEGLLRNLKDPAFAQWLFYGIAALFLWDKISAIIDRHKARQVQVEQPLHIKEAKEYADKGETAKAIERLNAKIEDLKAIITAQHESMLRAGEKRAATITESFGADLDKAEGRLESKLEALASEMRKEQGHIHDRVTEEAKNVASHESRLDSLESMGATHGAQISNILQRLPRPRG